MTEITLSRMEDEGEEEEPEFSVESDRFLGEV
jgi:hypothetical protein